MKNPVLQFVEFKTSEEEQRKLIRVFEEAHPRYSRWLRRAVITGKELKLTYNINTPTEKWLLKELSPLLESADLPTTVSIDFIRPGELDSRAREFFQKLKGRLSKDAVDLSWITEHEMPAIYYLAQYHFISLEYDNEILGFDSNYSTLYCKSWIAQLSVTESEGENLLNRWLEEK